MDQNTRTQRVSHNIPKRLCYMLNTLFVIKTRTELKHPPTHVQSSWQRVRFDSAFDKYTRKTPTINAGNAHVCVFIALLYTAIYAQKAPQMHAFTMHPLRRRVGFWSVREHFCLFSIRPGDCCCSLRHHMHTTCTTYIRCSYVHICVKYTSRRAAAAIACGYYSHVMCAINTLFINNSARNARAAQCV